jgi:tRNA(Ser,Leu) C12 N-acetylase TAN1
MATDKQVREMGRVFDVESLTSLELLRLEELAEELVPPDEQVGAAARQELTRRGLGSPAARREVIGPP